MSPPCEAALHAQHHRTRRLNLSTRDRGQGWSGLDRAPPPEQDGQALAVVDLSPAGLAFAHTRPPPRGRPFGEVGPLGGFCVRIPDFKLERISCPAHGADGGRVVEFRVNHTFFVNAMQRALLEDTRRRAGGGADLPAISVPDSSSTRALRMEFLPQHNRSCGDVVPRPILANGKHVVVIGWRDTSPIAWHVQPPLAERSRSSICLPHPPTENKPLVWPVALVRARSRTRELRTRLAVATKL